MASTAPNKILLATNDLAGNRPIRWDKADETLTPGELVRFDADDELEPHGTSGGVAFPMFVIETPGADPSSTKDIDTDVALGSYAPWIIAQRGDTINAFLKDGVNVAKGAALVSDGAGALTAYTAYTQAIDEGGDAEITITVNDGRIVAFAAEDKDNSAGAARVRIKVWVA